MPDKDFRIRSIVAAPLLGESPKGGWSNEIKPEDSVHALIAVLTHGGLTGYGSVFTSGGLVEAALMTTSRGPIEEDVFFVLTYADGNTKAVPLSQGEDLLTDLQALPGFDNEAFIEAMAVATDGVSVLWRANSG